MSDDAAAAAGSPRKRARVDVTSDKPDGAKKIALLTGALGGIGSATASVLRESGYEVIGMDRSQGESAADHFLQCDIRAFHADANSVRSQPTPASLRASPHSVVDAAACRSKTPSPRSARSAKASSTC
jgi:nucleoside-diphosphate-sugar epimerase